jgi:alpha-L-fucosidase 2
MLAENEPFKASHRHHSHCMAIHPLGTLHMEGTDQDRAVIAATLQCLGDRGTSAWLGYSYSWYACLLARAGQAEAALHALADYLRGFTLRNGFHANGDQSGTGLSQRRHRVFTLEANFLAMEALHEMLLQSWGGTVRVFPSVSTTWGDVSFSGLRAEGGFIVSARRRDRRTVQVRVEASVDQHLRMQNPFGNAAAAWNRSDVIIDDRYIRIFLRRGEVLEGTAR